MKRFLIVTAFIEGLTGLALLVIPSFVIHILFGSNLSDSPIILIARVAGVALFSLSIACWFSPKKESEKGLIIALLFYNVASVILLGYTGLSESSVGIALWPAIVTHIGMAYWSANYLNFAGKF